MIKTILLCSALLTPALLAERWKMQFFHDEDNSQLAIHDMVFPSANTGVACGVLSKNRSFKGIVLLTRDGGKAWNRLEVDDLPVSLNFINESTGFMVTNRGLWKTEERGLTWKKIKGWSNIRRVHFLDAERGFAIGPNRTMLATADGGKNWKPVEEAKKLSVNTDFHWVAFQSEKRGIVIGSSNVPRRRVSVLPEWIDPEAAQKDREWPNLSATLETKDGGATWTSETVPVFGKMMGVRFVPEGAYALSIIRYEHAFSAPAEVYLVNWKSGKSESTFRSPGKYVEDVAFLTPGSALIATIERPGKMTNSPFPGRLKILKSDNLRAWIEMPVDYRASGNHAVLAVVDNRNAWVALDSGMILRLEP